MLDPVRRKAIDCRSLGERLEDSWKQRSAVVIVNGLNGSGRELGHAIAGLEKELAYRELEKQLSNTNRLRPAGP